MAKQTPDLHAALRAHPLRWALLAGLASLALTGLQALGLPVLLARMLLAVGLGGVGWLALGDAPLSPTQQDLLVVSLAALGWLLGGL